MGGQREKRAEGKEKGNGKREERRGTAEACRPTAASSRGTLNAVRRTEGSCPRLVEPVTSLRGRTRRSLPRPLASLRVGVGMTIGEHPFLFSLFSLPPSLFSLFTVHRSPFTLHHALHRSLRLPQRPVRRAPAEGTGEGVGLGCAHSGDGMRWQLRALPPLPPADADKRASRVPRDPDRLTSPQSPPSQQIPL